MNVVLVGYNVYSPLLDSAGKKAILGSENPGSFTPEIISAAFARISRSEKSITELLEESARNIPQARRSNRAIVFEMNHASVAEHAVLNFAIEGISRIALEELEKYRLASYTEKSQRYVTLKGDFVVPEEFSQKVRREFRKIVKKQNELYHQLLEPLFQRQRESNPGRTQRDLENLAKEDARYVLSLATEGQVGCTFNARELEKIIREFKYHPLLEIQKLGQQLYREARRVVPSLVILASEAEFKRHTGNILDDNYLAAQRGSRDWAHFSMVLNRMGEGKITGKASGTPTGTEKSKIPGSKRITYFRSEDLDKKIITALISHQAAYDLNSAEEIYENMGPGQREDYLKAILRSLGPHDALPREFEMASFTFEAIVSASCYAQLKRHRMSTQLPGSYDPGLGTEIPASVREIGREKDFSEVMGLSEELYNKILEKSDSCLARYCLTNAHRRKVIVKMNLRELYHFSRLREDSHAQWEIRELAHELSGLARAAGPVTAALLCGKDQFEKVRGEVYGQ